MREDRDDNILLQSGIVLGIQNYLLFGGWKQVNITFVPTYIEGSQLKMSIEETIGRSIVSIATDIADIPEVINDRTTGFL